MCFSFVFAFVRHVLKVALLFTPRSLADGRPRVTTPHQLSPGEFFDLSRPQGTQWDLTLQKYQSFTTLRWSSPRPSDRASRNQRRLANRFICRRNAAASLERKFISAGAHGARGSTGSRSDQAAASSWDPRDAGTQAEHGRVPLWRGFVRSLPDVPACQHCRRRSRAAGAEPWPA